MYRFRRIVPGIFYLLMILSGIATSIGLYTWYRQYTLFFGTHTVSAVTVAVTMLFSMAIGSLCAGLLADKTPYRLTLFAILAGISGIGILADPFLFQLMTGLFYNMNTALSPGPFGIELLRLLLTLIFLFIPAGIMAGIFTLLIRHFIRHASEAGNFMSAIIVAGSTGVIVGLLLTSLYLIPQYGFRMAQILAAFLFIAGSSVSILYMVRRRLRVPADHQTPATQRVRKTVLRFKKRKTVLETGAKLTRAMIRVYTFQGFTTAAYLLICLRVLSYYNEMKPVHFHTLAISLTLAGLTLGSALYRWFTEKPANSFLTMATFQIITGFSAVLSYAALFVVQSIAFHKISESNTSIELLTSQVLLYATLILFPAVMTGLSLPLAGKLYLKRLQKTGSSFGRLAFIWFISAIFGIVITLFILIPLAGLYYAYFILALAIILSGVYLILRDSRLIRGFRLGYAVISVILYIVIVSAFKVFHFNLPLPENRTATKPVKMLEGSTTSLSTLEQPDGTRTVLLNNRDLFSSDPAGAKVQQIPAFLPILLNSNIQSAVVIGVGMGTTASVLEEYGITAIHITDIFPEIVRFSSDVFADDNDDILTSSHVNLTIEDARSYLMRTEEDVDLITTGYAQLVQMPNNYTTEFYRICFEKLSDKGLICQVLPTNGITANEFRTLIRAFSVVFPEVSMWYLTPERMLMIGAKIPQRPDLCRFYSDFQVLNRKDDLTMIGIPDPEILMARMLLSDRQIRQYVEGVSQNIDNKPIVQYSLNISKKTNEEILESLSAIPADDQFFLHTTGTCNRDIKETIRKISRFNEAFRQQLVPSSGSPE